MLNRVLGVLACFACLRACVLRCLAHLRAYVLGVLTCLRACVLTCLVCLCLWGRACYNEMLFFLTCLRTWCAFLSYLLYISILKFKNSHSKKKLCVLLSWIYFLFTFWYQLIPTFDTNLWNQFKGSRKVNRYVI